MIEVYYELMAKFNILQQELENCPINEENIEGCLLKLHALSKDLDMIRYFIRDLSTAATQTITTGQTTNNTFDTAPENARKKANYPVETATTTPPTSL